MARVMKADGFNAVCVGSIDALLQQTIPAEHAVLLIDVSTAQQSACSLHRQLNARGLHSPVIYVTDCDTASARSQARQTGAAGYFRKPVDEQALSDAITFAVQQAPESGVAESPGFE
jgi:FixJ family two-component response regulator